MVVAAKHKFSCKRNGRYLAICEKIFVWDHSLQKFCSLMDLANSHGYDISQGLRVIVQNDVSIYTEVRLLP